MNAGHEARLATQIINSTKVPAPLSSISQWRRPSVLTEVLPPEMQILFRPFAEATLSVAIERNIDPLWLTALIWTESSFQIHAQSPKGALGLMQILPDTAKAMLPSGSSDEAINQTLLGPWENIYLGAVYFSELMKSFRGNRSLATAAYNLGPSRVRELLTEGNWSALDNEYFKKVDEHYQELRKRAHHLSCRWPVTVTSKGPHDRCQKQVGLL